MLKILNKRGDSLLSAARCVAPFLAKITTLFQERFYSTVVFLEGFRIEVFGYSFNARLLAFFSRRKCAVNASNVADPTRTHSEALSGTSGAI